mmetsp:Transcript_110668/g.263900  ORF Transcript_110668/g.263900 Transcript_110668/m.263900 type:complete len:202 (+) Transcript_110668:205-810(+)
MAIFTARMEALTSWTVAGLVPRMFMIVSTRSPKCKGRPSFSRTSSKMRSSISIRTFTSTSMPYKKLIISGSLTSSSTDCLGIGPSRSTPSFFMAWRSVEATVETCKLSRSEAATISMTLTITPTSMYIMVTEVMRMNSMVQGQKMGCHAEISLTNWALSAKRHWSSKVFITESTESKSEARLSVGSVFTMMVSCFMTSAKR